MSIQALNWALAQDQIGNSSTRFVLLVLCNYASETGECYPSRETLSRKTSLSVRSVQMHLNWLTENGFISRKSQRNGQRQSANLYQIQSAEFAPSEPSQGANHVSQGANDDISQGEPFAPNTKEEEPSLRTKEKSGTAKKTKAPETLKTRPDIPDDREWLVTLRGLDENRGIDIVGLYDRMLAWCERERQTPSRLRLLNWISREREAVPVSYRPPVRNGFDPGRVVEPVEDAVAALPPDKPRRPAAPVPIEQQHVWNAVRDALQRRLPAETYASWFAGVLFDGINDEKNALKVRAGAITVDWIRQYYAGMLIEVLEELGLAEFTFKWEVEGDDIAEVASV